jgi:enoyl-CoA hydratase
VKLAIAILRLKYLQIITLLNKKVSMARIITQKKGAVGIITISNPEKMNAMTLDMWSAIPVAIQSFDADAEVRVIVVSGEGEKAFISGADISQFDKLRGTADAQEQYNQAVTAAYQAPIVCSKPVIASIRGYCFGGGLGFSASCDIRICSEDAQFRMPAARLGLGYSPEGIRRFMSILGPANTADIFFSARRFNARDALQMGFVSKVHPDADLEKLTMEYAQLISENAPLTVAASKFAIKQALLDPELKDLERATEMVKICFASEDYKEGRKAFAEKRTPQFTGK